MNKIVSVLEDLDRKIEGLSDTMSMELALNFTAKVAQKVSERAGRMEARLKAVLNMVLQEAKRGYNGVNIKNHLDSEVIAKLIEMGYRVEDRNPKEALKSPNYRVSWGEAKEKFTGEINDF